MKPSAAASSRGERGSRCSGISEGGAAADHEPRRVSRKLAVSLVAWGSLAHLQAPSFRTWGHFLHTGLWRKSLHPCLVIPFESINYLKPGEKRRAVPAAPLLAHKVQLVPSIQRPFSRGGQARGMGVTWGGLSHQRGGACTTTMLHQSRAERGTVTAQGLVWAPQSQGGRDPCPCVQGPRDRIALTPGPGQQRGGPTGGPGLGRGSRVLAL